MTPREPLNRQTMAPKARMQPLLTSFLIDAEQVETDAAVTPGVSRRLKVPQAQRHP
jgi:hypothetical protein